MSPLAWSFLLSAVGIVGILLAGSKRKIGWLVGFAVQPLWIVFAITTGQYGFILNAVIYAAVYARNWLRWRKEETPRRPRGSRRRAVFITDASDPLFGRHAWSTRYDATDAAMGRPIHAGMTVAPPWAMRERVRPAFRR